MSPKYSIARPFVLAAALAFGVSGLVPAVANDAPAQPSPTKPLKFNPNAAKKADKPVAHKPLPAIDFEKIFAHPQFKMMEEHILENSARSGLSSEKLRTAAKDYATKFVQYMVDNDQKYSAEDLHNVTIQGMFESLSPHDEFIPASKTEAYNQSLSGEGFVGLGIQIGKHEKGIAVNEIIEDGAADKSGLLKEGDVITEADGKSFQGLDMDDAVKVMRGEPGSVARLKVLRGNQTLDINLTRAQVQTKMVKYRMLGDGVAHIKIVQFSPQVNLAVKHAIAQAKADAELDPTLKAKGGLRGMVLDFRFDPGGLLPEANAISDDFIDSNGVIVSSQGRNPEYGERHSAKPGRIIKDDVPVVVLINEGSASASEIVAGALQDHQQATIIGTDTFGKGTVQQISGLSDKSQAKVTIAIFRRPSGVSNQWVGVKPDIRVETLNAQYNAFMKNATTERTLPNSLPNSHGLESQKGVTKQVCQPTRAGIKLSDAPNDSGIFVKKYDFESRWRLPEGAPEGTKPEKVAPFAIGDLDPFLECARHHILKTVQPNYTSPYTTIRPLTLTN